MNSNVGQFVTSGAEVQSHRRSSQEQGEWEGSPSWSFPAGGRPSLGPVPHELCSVVCSQLFR